MDCPFDSGGIVAGVLAGSHSLAPDFEQSLGFLESDHKTPVPHLIAPMTRSRELIKDHSIIPALDLLFSERERWRTLGWRLEGSRGHSLQGGARGASGAPPSLSHPLHAWYQRAGFGRQPI